MCQCCKSPSTWITLLKLALGLTSFAFFTFNYQHYDTFDYFCGSYGQASGLCIVRKNIAMTACTAFTFIIEPAVLIAHFKQSLEYEKSPLSVIFPAIGFLTYTIGGSSMIYSALDLPDFGTGTKLTDCIYDAVKRVYSPPEYLETRFVFGSPNADNGLIYVGSIIFLVTGIVYLIHLFVAMFRRCRSAPVPYTLVQTNHELATV